MTQVLSYPTDINHALNLGNAYSRTANLTHTYKKDDLIYFPDRPSNQIYCITKGKIKITTYTDDGREVLKRILTQGDVFGELALVGEEKRTDFAIAMENNTVISTINVKDVYEFMNVNKELSAKIFNLIGSRIKQLERKIESLTFKSARSRIVDFIKDLAQEKGKKIGYETLVANHYTHQDIADLTGISRQTVTTILNELKSENQINMNRKRILIRDLPSLQ
ncbi:Crp/Fnr family transcriptional regulator [Fulvivirgaceae bacterium BMA10]|uniref:Crp/Fnr family transcriptional regulator n=1 Tax=Splendidivirga corallicola TaxID=3051826 RepID=A0ABT8KQ52_9BACT|nr:Crp/Fnr family transcriptional regulator [Fulvivirgaceae bacterium BMA10]